MQKDFDEWNEKKKYLEETGEFRLYHERELWWCRLGTNVGFEQDGQGKEFWRPVLIIKGFSKEVCIVVPLTTSSKRDKYRLDAGTVDGKKAAAIISQLRLIDTRRLVNHIGHADQLVFATIKKAIKNLF